jgi:hypothetical protein
LTDLPQIKEWTVKKGVTKYSLLVELDYVSWAEIHPSPFASGSIKCSYEEFLAGKAHNAIRAEHGEAVLQEALALVLHNLGLRK